MKALGIIIMVITAIPVIIMGYLIITSIVTEPPSSPDTIVGFSYSYPYTVILKDGNRLPVPAHVNYTEENIYSPCGFKWAMEDQHITRYSDFQNITYLYWDGQWKGDSNC